MSYLNNERSLSVVLTVVEAFAEKQESRISDKAMKRELADLRKMCVAIADGKQKRDSKIDYILQKWWLTANQYDPELVNYVKSAMGFTN